MKRNNPAHTIFCSSCSQFSCNSTLYFKEKATPWENLDSGKTYRDADMLKAIVFTSGEWCLLWAPYIFDFSLESYNNGTVELRWSSNSLQSPNYCIFMTNVHLITSMKKESTISLGNWFFWWTVLTVEKAFLTSNSLGYCLYSSFVI